MRYRLLLVEPTWETAARLSAVFDTARFALYWARDLAEGRTALRRLDTLDLVVLNPALPDGRGLDLCHEMKVARPSLPIVVLAAAAGHRDRAVASCADLVVDSSADPRDIKAAVRRLLPVLPWRGRSA